MMEFFSWFKSVQPAKKWLIVGKGPTFARRKEVNLGEYNVLALNHVVREMDVQIAHMIDINVVRELGIEGISRAGMVLIPYHPHVNFNATDRALPDFLPEYPELRKLDEENHLLWYNLSTWPRPERVAPIVQVAYFSAEAAVRLLSMAGVKTIRTLGVDGGAAYAQEFTDHKPFRGGHATFDLQWQSIYATVKEFGVDFGALFLADGGILA